MFSFRSLATVLILVTQAKVSADTESAVHCSDIESETVLDFKNATVASSNVEEKGGELRFQNVGNYREGDAITPIDLVVKKAPGTKYKPKNLANNKLNGYYGMINVDSDNGEGTFDFCFVNPENKEKVFLDAFFFSFYDMDGAKDDKGLESISLKSDAFTDFFLSDETEIIHSESNGFMKFDATKKGSGDDNPEDPNKLSPLQQNRGVVFQMKRTDCFRVKMSVTCPGKKCRNSGGRNFLFAGRANQLVPKCAPKPSSSPSSSPTSSPTGGPTSSPTSSPTGGPTSSPTLSPTKGPTSVPTSSPTDGPTSSPTTQPTALGYNSGGAKTMASSTLRPTGQQTTNSPSAAERTRYMGANGDPHFKTWSGERYDFHGICDLILLSNPNFNDNLGMDIYIRSKKTKQWSYISTAVIRIGVDTFEVSGRKDGDTYWVNGIEGDVEGDDTLWDERTNIAGYPIKYQRVHSIQREYVINLGESNEKIIFKTWKDFVRVDVVNPRDEDFTGSMGLIGSYPDGTIVGRFNPLSSMKDRNAFGQEWQVLSSDPKLFHSVEGPQYPARCVLPTKSSLRRRLSKSEISREDAEVSCSSITDDEERDLCIFDVMATNDKVTAEAY